MGSALGIERIGLAAMRCPRAVLLGLLVVLLLSGYGLSRVSFNSDLREIYRTNSSAFAELVAMTRQYATGANEVYVLLEGPALLTRPTLRRLRELHLDLRFVDGVNQVTSVFSARAPPSPERRSRPLIPSQIPEGRALQSIIARLHAHPFAGGTLLSRDGRTALMIVELAGRNNSLSEFRALVARLRATVDKGLTETGVTASLTGLPVMRLEIIQELLRNQFIFMGLALGLGLLICSLVLQSARLVLLAVTPTLLGMLMVFGAMAAMGQEVNVLTNVVPVLVAVIALSDSLHLLFAIRREREAGCDLADAVRRSVREVGPACVMTSVTTAIALSSLMLVPHGLISGFGLTAALGVILAFLAAILGVPALAMLFLRRWQPAPAAEAPRLIRAGQHLSGALAGFVNTRPRLISIAGVAVLILAGSFYFQNESRYVYREYLPHSNPAHQALQRLDRSLAGTSSIRVVLTWPAPRDRLDEKALAVTAKIHRYLAAYPFVRKTWSLHGVLMWLESGGASRADAIARLKAADERFRRRLISLDGRSTMVLAQFPDRDASVLLPSIRRIERDVAKIAAAAGVTAHVTGISVIAATSMTEMIDRLKSSLLLSIFLIVVVIGVANRSLVFGAVSVLPNLLPIVAAAAFLWATDSGFQASSVVAFVVGFGMAVDSTIHFLNYFRRRAGAGMTPAGATRETIVALGPVVLMSTLVLLVGLGSTITSNMPTMQNFGVVSVIVLLVALVGDLVVLPATLTLLGRRWSQRGSVNSARTPERSPK